MAVPVCSQVADISPATPGGCPTLPSHTRGAGAWPVGRAPFPSGSARPMHAAKAQPFAPGGLLVKVGKKKGGDPDVPS
jgi:hypothetical protein